MAKLDHFGFKTSYILEGVEKTITMEELDLHIIMTYLPFVLEFIHLFLGFLKNASRRRTLR
jgi:hypothetical protein